MLSEEVRDRLVEILPTILTIRDIAEFLAVDNKTVRRLIWDSELSAYIADGEWNITRSDFMKFLSTHSSL